MKKENLYICMGQKFINSNLIGGAICGDVRTLKKWLEIFFPNKQDIVKDYFKGYSDKEISEYIYKNCGARLEKFRK